MNNQNLNFSFFNDINIFNNFKNINIKKRYFGSPLRYGGGKTLAVKDILPLIPNDIDLVVSPFIGGGSVEIAIAKELNKKVIAYDIFDLLVNYWQVQINKPKELASELEKLNNTKEEYENVKNKLKKIWNKNDGLLKNNYSSLELASMYYFSHNLSYGPGFLGWMSRNYLNNKKYQSMIKKVREFDCKNLEVFNESFEKVLLKYKNNFMYLDPPYYLDGDSKMFKGIYPMRNFPIHHNNFKHELLLELLNKHKGGFVLSYNNCSFVREAYKDFEIREIYWQYTMGQGETRIGKNRKERNYDNSNVKHSHELLIIGKRKI